jgi:hypothetical protein
VFRCFGTRETQGSVSLYSPVPKSQLAKPRNDSVDEIWCFGVSAPGISKGKSLVLASPEIPTCETPKWHSVSRVWMFRCFGTRETQGSVPLYSPVAKSRLAKPRNGNSVDKILVFRFHPGNLRVSSLVLASPEIPTCETPKWYSVDRVWCFGVSAPGISKGKSPCTRQSRNPDLRNPEMA